jgi:ATP/maltotriose-dependent transcriptional regulator MalT
MRGELEAAAALAQRVAERAHQIAHPQVLAFAYPPAAALRVARGDIPGARALLTELSKADPVAASAPYAANLATTTRAALAAGAPGLAARLVSKLEPRHPLEQHAVVTARALLAEQQGRHTEAAGLFADAADRWKKFEMPWERAQALLGHGRCLLALGQPTAAPLRAARDILATLGAKPALTDADRLLAQATAATA